jgi:hypothetical protein
MALNLATLLPAKIGTSEIATKYDVSSSIAAYNPATAINTNTTTIDGGKITTGSITAGQIAANTITTSKLTTNIGLVNGYIYSSNFNGNVSGNIGAPTAGFRLSSIAAGTSADPTIYGAYIKGGTIDGVSLIGQTLNVNNLFVASTSHPNNTAKLLISLTLKSQLGLSGGTITIHSKSFGSGFLATRNLRSDYGVKITGLAAYGKLQLSIDGGAWVTIASGGVSVSNGLSYSIESTPFGLYDTTAFANTKEYRLVTDTVANEWWSATAFFEVFNQDN